MATALNAADLVSAAAHLLESPDPISNYQRRLIAAALRIVERELGASDGAWTQSDRSRVAEGVRIGEHTDETLKAIRDDAVRRLLIDNPRYLALRREPHD